ncbi:TerB family tellurite resistance protein [Luteibacter aegosomatis]|uniref:tellurite resistance TerB family protein n=1 Tax=Luteibacter aegosomatis TaxID=2911537 RepID=UPI001FFAE78B|nr:TerB family tellurite resistance protein [Luteibacter aegosomatis]UPG87627.1 TerB family tellurite resistance protein [Luteibacter aegosomatis]
MGWDFDFDLDFLKRADGSVSYWKVLGGAAAGVAAVVALPVAGGVGAVTLAGAAIASAVGGAAGAAASMFDDTEKKAEARGEARGAARSNAQYDKLKAALDAAVGRARESHQYFALITAMHAVGMACAACDGVVAPEEKRDIEEFIGGLASTALPAKVREDLEAMAAHPPSMATAFELAKAYGTDSMDLFDEIIDMVIQSDGHVHEKEVAFRAQWAQLKAAA